jgi:hypothetical protein
MTTLAQSAEGETIDLGRGVGVVDTSKKIIGEDGKEISLHDHLVEADKLDNELLEAMKSCPIGPIT